MEFRLHKVRGAAESFKFLWLTDGSFIVGNVGTHRTLWYGYCRDTGRDYRVNPTLRGAGMFDQNGSIGNWISTSFKFQTPEEDRVDIVQFVLQILPGLN